MLLAQDPKLLLVDEPVAGMTDAETVETAKLLRQISKTHSVIVVEHDMGFIRDLDVKVTVLQKGRFWQKGRLIMSAPIRTSLKVIWGDKHE